MSRYLSSLTHGIATLFRGSHEKSFLGPMHTHHDVLTLITISINLIQFMLTNSYYFLEHAN